MKIRLTNKIDWSHEFEASNKREFFARLNAAYLDFRQNCKIRVGPVIHIFVPEWGHWVDLRQGREFCESLVTNPLSQQCYSPLWEQLSVTDEECSDFCEKLGVFLSDIEAHVTGDNDDPH